MAKTNEQLYEESGRFNTKDPLVCLLYELLRDHISPGKLEQLVRSNEDNEEFVLTNGFIANYALHLAMRIRCHNPKYGINGKD